MTVSRKEQALLTRKKIIAAAIEIVGCSGYEKLTTNALITEAGVAKGTLYHHFNNLDEVIYAMIESILFQTLDDVPVEEYQSMEEYLAAMGKFLIYDFSENSKIMNVVYGFIPKGMKDSAFQEIAQSLIKSGCDRIAPAIQLFYGNKLPAEKVDHVIQMIDIFSAGFCFHYCIIKDTEKYQAIWNEFCTQLIASLEK